MAIMEILRLKQRPFPSGQTRANIETLEQRQLLSISGPPLAGPYSQIGAFWTYNVTTSKGESATFYVKAVGPVTFNGINCYELDEGSKLQAKVYEGLDSAGNLVQYGNTAQLGTSTQIDTYSPAELALPALITAGVPYTSDYTDTVTSTGSDGTTTNESVDTQHDVTTLGSETPAPITVTAGTYEAYTLHSDSTTHDSTGAVSDQNSADIQFVPGVGYVKATDSNGSVFELVSFQNQPDHLVFSQGPATTAMGQTIQPAVTVSAVDPGGAPDPNDTGSVTLTIASASRLTTYNGALGGTVTEPLVNGIATFSDLSVSQDGIYTLSATDTASDTGATSDKFKIGSSTLTVEINDRVITKSKASAGKGVSPGDTILYSVLVTPLTNTIQDAALVVTLPSGFTPTGLTGGGTFSGNTITWNVNTRVYNFDLTVPAAKTLNGLKAVVVSGDDNVTYTDATTDEATGSNSENIATVSALDFVQNPSNAVAGKTIAPPVTVAVKDIYGAVDTTATDTITLVLKGGALGGTRSAVAVNGVATFPNLTISKAGKYTLTATDASNKKIKAATSDQFVMVSLLTIVGTKGSSKRISHDDSLDITDSNSYAVEQSANSLSLLATGFTPNTPGGLGQVHWAEQRNSDDVATGTEPTISQTGALTASVNLNEAVGSFNLICYYDTNSNGQYDSGEELKVYHLAAVGVTVQSGNIVPSNASFVGKTFSNGTATVVSGNFSGNHWAITTTETVRVLGGGADGTIGVSKIHVGWLQNGIGDTFVVTYQNGTTATEQLKAGSFPVLDSTYLGAKSAIFELPPDELDNPPASPGPARDPAIGNDPAGGQDRTVATADSPTVTFDTQKGKSDSVSTTGANYFAQYLTAYSDDFSGSYEAYYKVNWSAAFVFTRTSDGGWQDAGSSVVDTTADLGSGTDLSSLNVNIKGPRFNKDAIVR